MTKYRESKAAQTTKTYNRNELESNTENIYEALSIIAKRSQQINLEIKKSYMRSSMSLQHIMIA